MTLTSPLPPTLASLVTEVPILVVGAGGIGCELLKNLVLTGFKNITIIDLDTIDTSNLNRQFLFQKRHVGQSKSKVAKESALEFVPSAKIEALHDSITSPDYNITFFKKFKVVFNALDNRAARSHVNRMCLAADVTLIESGTAGYFGQVAVIRKNLTECYDCEVKTPQKTFPGCTIRNTPSQLIHCIVWSKHLFNQLFGETESDEEVSPDAEDPEANKENGSNGADKNGHKNDGNVVRISTRQWAIDCDYNPKLIFQKLFHDDIKYLLTMDKLWAKRRPPVPLDWDQLPANQSDHEEVGLIHDQQMWSINQCVKVFEESVKKLSQKFKESDYKDFLSWDKDDEPAMDFVAACSNIRAQIFGIPQKSRFDVKSQAGNIVPAIATTNAIIAGCIVMEGLKIINGQFDKCNTVYLRHVKNTYNRILIPCQLDRPNPKCYVCSEKREVNVTVPLSKMSLKVFEDKVLKGRLNVVEPDLEIDGKGVVLISSDPDDETSVNHEKTLHDMGVTDGSALKCDDFLQDYNVIIYIYNKDDLESTEFEMGKEPAKNGKKEEETKKDEPKKTEENKEKEGNQSMDQSASRKRPAAPTTEPDDDDDFEIVEAPVTKKQKMDPQASANLQDDDESDEELFYEEKAEKADWELIAVDD